MKHFTIAALMAMTFAVGKATGVHCDVNGNLMIFTNYDGGPLNIVVDANIANLKIGVVTYEACQITLSGPYVSNVTGVVYAGYSGTNNHCSSGTTTSITGAPAGATTAVLFAPAVTVSNPNGYGSLICGYSCSTTTSQGGCNTIDQIEAYFMNYFPGSTVFAHRVQYGCWIGNQNISAGGDCCASVTNLTLTTKVTDESCSSACDGAVLAGAAGGMAPYNITINGGTNFNNLCSGPYNVQVVDASSTTVTQSVSVATTGILPPTGDHQQTFCGSATVADLVAGGTNLSWYASPTGGTPLASNLVLTNNTTYYGSQSVGGCESGTRLDVLVTIEVSDVTVTQNNTTLSAAASGLTYQWVDCGKGYAIIPSATAQVYTATSNGSYAVIITENTCSDTSACYDVTTIGIRESDSDMPVSVLPNPFNNELQISGPNLSSLSFIRLTDLQGREVFKQSSVQGNLIRINTSAFNKGIYILELHSQNLIYRRKIIRE